MRYSIIDPMRANDLIAKKLGVLGHPIRLAIIRLLVRSGPAGLAAGYLSEQLNAAPNALTFHLQKLLAVGLVTSQRQGQFIIYTAAFSDLLQLADDLVGACCTDSPDTCGPECPSNDDAVSNTLSKITHSAGDLK